MSATSNMHPSYASFAPSYASFAPVLYASLCPRYSHIIDNNSPFLPWHDVGLYIVYIYKHSFFPGITIINIIYISYLSLFSR